MINVIVAEELVDRDYVENYTVGYEDLKARAAGFDPDRVAGITGLAAGDIRTLAREFATTQPSVIRMGVAIERNASGGNAVRAMSCLPALVGSWRHCGGGILHMPIWAFPLNWDALSRPDWIPEGTPVLNQWRLGPALRGELDRKIGSLFVYNSNPAVVAPEQDKVLRGLAREDLFTVVSEQFVTDTARYADIVLPATTQLEQFDIMYSWGHLYLTLNEPAIEPLGEAVPNTELFRRLAGAMGFDDPYWRRSDEDMARDALDWSNPALEGIDLDSLRRTGYARLNVGSPDDFAPHREGNFPTPSGKVEFKSSIAEGGNLVLPLFRQGYAAFQPGEPLDPVPDFIPQNESADTNPALAAQLSAQPDLAEEPRLPQLLLRQFANPAPSRRRADGDDQPGGRGAAGHRRRRRDPGVQRPGRFPRDCAAQRGHPPGRGRGADGLLGRGEPQRIYGERGQPAGLRRLRQRAHVFRYPGRGGGRLTVQVERGKGIAVRSVTGGTAPFFRARSRSTMIRPAGTWGFHRHVARL